ncbi:MAG TPA: hypothetical protein VHN74_10545 [Candidatus Angelobacter sp.]|jgi:hypothetical protein|nr:hypothetical protein [Candidatus Angelobacter sp.]
MRITKRTVVFKGLAAATVAIIIILLKKADFKGAYLTALYLLPYLAGVIMPLKFTDFAAGLCFGATLVQLPFTLFFSVFGGIFPDAFSFLMMRLSSILLIALAVASIVAYRQPGSHFERFLGAVFVSICYIAVIAALI